MPQVQLAAGTGVGDRLFFAAGEQLYALQTKTLQPGAPIPIGGAVTAIAVTPSGDRIYVLATIADHSSLIAVDRYRARVASQLALGTKARALRVDPLGRYVLVRGPLDSVFVVAVSSNRAIGTVRSDWRDDLPLVAPDGSVPRQSAATSSSSAPRTSIWSAASVRAHPTSGLPSGGPGFVHGLRPWMFPSPLIRPPRHRKPPRKRPWRPRIPPERRPP